MAQWWEHSPPTTVSGFDSQTPRHMWLDFVGSLLRTERFFSRYSCFPLSSKTYHFLWFDLIWWIQLSVPRLGLQPFSSFMSLQENPYWEFALLHILLQRNYSINEYYTKVKSLYLTSVFPSVTKLVSMEADRQPPARCINWESILKRRETGLRREKPSIQAPKIWLEILLSSCYTLSYI